MGAVQDHSHAIRSDTFIITCHIMQVPEQIAQGSITETACPCWNGGTVEIDLGGVGMISSLMPSLTRLRRFFFSPRSGGDSITIATSPVATPCGIKHSIKHPFLMCLP